MEHSADSDLALAFAMAENSQDVSDGDDDFQSPSIANQQQLFIIRSCDDLSRQRGRSSSKRQDVRQHRQALQSLSGIATVHKRKNVEQVKQPGGKENRSNNTVFKKKKAEIAFNKDKRVDCVDTFQALRLSQDDGREISIPSVPRGNISNPKPLSLPVKEGESVAPLESQADYEDAFEFLGLTRQERENILPSDTWTSETTSCVEGPIKHLFPSLGGVVTSGESILSCRVRASFANEAKHSEIEELSEAIPSVYEAEREGWKKAKKYTKCHNLLNHTSQAEDALSMGNNNDTALLGKLACNIEVHAHVNDRLLTGHASLDDIRQLGEVTSLAECDPLFDKAPPTGKQKEQDVLANHRCRKVGSSYPLTLGHQRLQERASILPSGTWTSETASCVEGPIKHLFPSLGGVVSILSCRVRASSDKEAKHSEIEELSESIPSVYEAEREGSKKAKKYAEGHNLSNHTSQAEDALSMGNNNDMGQMACNFEVHAHVHVNDRLLIGHESLDNIGQLGEVMTLAESDLVFDKAPPTGKEKEQDVLANHSCRKVEYDNIPLCTPLTIANSESQFSALLRLCVGVANEDSETEGSSLATLDYRGSSDCAAGPIRSLENEEDITSIMTQQKSREMDDENMSLGLEVDHALEPDKEPLVLAVTSQNYQNIEAQSGQQNSKLEASYVSADDIWCECPICGCCMTSMTHEQRQLHTNACLDSTNQESQFEAQYKNQLSEDKDNETIPLCDTSPVLRWLETLNLSRYADVFIREEIDWDTLCCLTDEDLNTLGIKALGPRRKILHALQELQKGKLEAATESASEKNIETAISTNLNTDPAGKTRITDFFALPPSLQMSKTLNPPQVPESSNRGNTRGPSKVVARRTPSQLGGLPEWMCIPDTNFRVDAFQHLRSDCSHWFLTHFHTDHYQGLTRGFRYGHVYCSSITAELVSSRINVPRERLKTLPLNVKTDIDGVKVTFINANHCPGAVMILFEPPNGKAVLHTGDFRFSKEMVNNLFLQACNIHTLMLDTTYCNPQYDFPNQEVVIQFIIDAIQAEAFNPNTLFLIGTYTIGKERIFFEVAKVLEKKIYISATKLRLLRHMAFSEDDMRWLTTNEEEAHIHVVPLWTIASFKRMKFVSRHYHGRYSSIISFSPTGWSFGRGRKRTPGRRWQQGTIIRYEVPYSEHCSFNELREFVRFIAPENIVPSVNNTGAEAADSLVALLLNEEEGS